MSVQADDFKDFLEGYKKELTSGITGLVIDFEDLKKYDARLAEGVLNEPDIYLTEFRKSTLNFSTEEIDILIKNVPRELMLRELGSEYLGKLISLNGIVCRVIPTRPMIKLAAFQCRKCQRIKYVEQYEPFLLRPDRCGKGCKSRQFRLLEDPTETIYFDVQELSIQDKPEDLKSGQAPQLVNIEITRKSLINGARAGDIVDVVGVLRTKPPTASTKERKWGIYIDAIYLERINKDPSDILISPEEEQEIRWLASDSNIYDKIKSSIAPSIHGCDEIKEAIMYQLFGGREKYFPDKIVRGNIHVLWIDDPSKAKSQILLAVKNIAPRGLYVAGGGASGAGLTAAVVKVEKEIWALEAGAVVLANGGICCIDEIEKMNDEDRARIHEAMEQQQVNIQKATAHYQLPARTAILAAGNPKFGRYDVNRTVGENISLPTTILPRFDLIFIGRGDNPNEEEDRLLAEFILEKAEKVVIPINRETLRKYIALAKRINPEFDAKANEYIMDFYIKMRKAGHNRDADNPIAITPRQLEGLMRIAEAHARIRLSEKVEEQDAQASINLMMESLRQAGIDPETGKIDIDTIMTGIPTTVRSKMGIIMQILSDGESHSNDEIIDKLEEKNISKGDVMRIINKLLSEGSIYSPSDGYYRKVR